MARRANDTGRGSRGGRARPGSLGALVGMAGSTTGTGRGEVVVTGPWDGSGGEDT